MAPPPERGGVYEQIRFCLLIDGYVDMPNNHPGKKLESRH